jgi:hypothetical protein
VYFNIERKCIFCNTNSVEDEIHVLLDCDFCSDLRYALTENACILFENFENLILEDKFLFIMSKWNTVNIYTTYLRYLWFIKIHVITNNTFFYKTYYIKFLLKKGSYVKDVLNRQRRRILSNFRSGCLH